jgi:hypothetical protein
MSTDSNVQIERKRHAFLQRDTDAIVDRILDVRAELQHAVIDYHKCRSNLQITGQRTRRPRN